MNEFKKLLNGNILLDGILWGRSPERAIRVRRNDEGTMLLNIKYEDEFYYPIAIDKSANKGDYSLFPKEETAW